MTEGNFFKFNSGNKEYRFEHMSQDKLDLEKIENEKLKAFLKDSVFAKKYDKDGSGAIDTTEEFKAVWNDMLKAAASNKQGDDKVFEEGEIKEFLGVEDLDEETKGTFMEFVNSFFGTKKSENIEDSEFDNSVETSNDTTEEPDVSRTTVEKESLKKEVYSYTNEKGEKVQEKRELYPNGLPKSIEFEINGKVVQKAEYQYKVNIQTGENFVETNITNENGNYNTIAKAGEDGLKLLSQDYIKDGKTYSVRFDDNGNTIIYAKNNDNLSRLSKNFNMTIKELIELNPKIDMGQKRTT